MTDLWLVAQAERSDAGRNVETGAPFDADRLQRDRSAGATDQYIGAGADTYRGTAGGTDILPASAPGARLEVGASTPQIRTPPWV